MSRRIQRGPPRDLIDGNRGNKGDLLRNKGPDLPGNKSNSTLTQTTSLFLSELNASLVALNFAIVALHVISILVLIKCKRLSYQIKYFSVNYLLANTIYNTVNAVHLLNVYIHEGRTAWATILQRQLMTFVSGVSWCSMALLAVERILALQLSIRYALIVTKRRVVATVAGIWLVNLAIVLSTLFGTVVKCNGWTLTACAPDGNKRITRGYALEIKVAMIVFLIYSIILLLAIMKLHSIIKSHLKLSSRFQAGESTATKTDDRQKTSRFVLKLQVVHLLLHIPVVVYFIYFEIQRESGTKNADGPWVRRVSDFSLALHSFLTLVLYTWNFKECRLVFLTLFCSRCTCLRNRLQNMRAQLYGHFTMESKERVVINPTNGSPVMLSGRSTASSFSLCQDSRY